MYDIHYDQIGSLQWCDEYVDKLPSLMQKALAGDKDAQLLVVNCAAHFYGLVIWDFDNDVAQLIDAIKSIDNQLEFK